MIGLFEITSTAKENIDVHVTKPRSYWNNSSCSKNWNDVTYRQNVFSYFWKRWRKQTWQQSVVQRRWQQDNNMRATALIVCFDLVFWSNNLILSQVLPSSDSSSPRAQSSEDEHVRNESLATNNETCPPPCARKLLRSTTKPSQGQTTGSYEPPYYTPFSQPPQVYQRPVTKAGGVKSGSKHTQFQNMKVEKIRPSMGDGILITQ